MRVTDQILVDLTVQNLWDNENRIAEIQNQLTTGKRLSKISDAPQDGARALTIQASIDQGNQYLRNIDAASSWLSATDTALANVSQALLRAQELAVEGANDTLSAADRQAMASEVDALIGQMVQVGNSTYADSYLFAGAATTSAPFAYTGGVVTYTNSDPVSATAALTREISTSMRIQVNTIGHDPTTGAALFDRVFAALTSFRQALQANNTAAIKAVIPQLQDAENQLLQERASVGAKLNQVNAMRDQLTSTQLRLQQFQSTLVDADMVQAATDYAQADIVRRASMAAAARTLPPSLFDYLI